MKKPEIKPVTAACAALGLLVAVLAAAVVSQHIAGARLSGQVAKQREQLSETSKSAEAYRLLSGNYYQLSSQVGGRLRTVSWDRQMPQMVNQLTGIMNAHGIEIETLKPETITTVDSISRFPLRISFKTSLESLARALRDIEKASPVMAIEQVSIRVADAGTETLQADAIISSFAIADKNAPARVAPPGGKQAADALDIKITPVADPRPQGGAK